MERNNDSIWGTGRGPARPKPIRRDYQLGQIVQVTKKDEDGILRRVEATIIGMDAYKVLTMVKSGLAVYRECYQYFDLN